MKTMRKFTTTNIDEAAVLCAYGYRCQIRRIGIRLSQFRFKLDEPGEKIVRNFANGKLKIHIGMYQYHRMTLKHHTRQLFIERDTPAPKPVVQAEGMKNGEHYYYVENGKVLTNMWAPRDPHMLRLQKRNVFRTLEDAEQAIISMENVSEFND